MTRRNLVAVFGVILAVAPAAPAAESHLLAPDDRSLLASYARDTWRSFEAFTQPGGLPADELRRVESGWVASGYTSPTNIAAYLWSTLAAERLHLIGPAEADRRLAETLDSVSRLERSHGFFFNWYDPRTGARLRAWPGGDVAVRPFLSLVDNGWLAAALMMVGNARPAFREAAEAILAPMDFGFFYDPFDPTAPDAHPGLLRGGYWPDDRAFAGFHYGMLNTEPRIASYVGIARGQLPPEHYYRMSRATRGRPSAASAFPTRDYLGVPVVQGYRDYRGLKVVPSWDGTMFEALMVPLFVPEAAWAPRSWGRNHPLYVRAQIEHGLHDARLGAWGVSSSTTPSGGYRVYGVSALGACSRPSPRPTDAVVTPHASFLALPFAQDESMANLKALATRYSAYGDYGFFDAVDIANNQVSDRVLSLDQGMILAAIANTLDDNILQRTFCAGAIEAKIPSLIGPESFEVGVDEVARAALGTTLGRLSPGPAPRHFEAAPGSSRFAILGRRPVVRRVTGTPLPAPEEA